MGLLKKRIYASAFLLFAVLLMNICGYFYIRGKAIENNSIEQGITALNNLQVQSQEVSQTIIVLSIHQSFTAQKYREQKQGLKQTVSKFKNDYRSLQAIFKNNKFLTGTGAPVFFRGGCMLYQAYTTG
jgi:hypothetical protein